MYSSDIEFLRNIFARCRGFRSYGILYQSMDDTRAESNLVLDNSRGIFLNNSATNLLLRNDVVDNDLAIQLNGDGGGNVVAGNNFINNLSELLLDIGRPEIDWENAEGGNYWTDYRGYDLDGDGIGDRPHTIQNVFQVLENDYPEVRFYLFSLAARMLEMAEQALPILELGNAQDLSPRFRPMVNDQVPWVMVQQSYHRSNKGAALVYLLATAIPLLLLFRIGRRI
jgi:nitrous oxidase accessory protein